MSLTDTSKNEKFWNDVREIKVDRISKGLNHCYGFNTRNNSNFAPTDLKVHLIFAELLDYTIHERLISVIATSVSDAIDQAVKILKEDIITNDHYIYCDFCGK